MTGSIRLNQVAPLQPTIQPSGNPTPVIQPKSPAPVSTSSSPEVNQLLRQSQSSASSGSLPLPVGHPEALREDRGSIAQLESPPVGLMEASRELNQDRRMNRTMRTAEILTGHQLIPPKTAWQTFVSLFVGGNERATKARSLSQDLDQHGGEALKGQSEKLKSWAKWEGRVEGSGLVQKLPQGGAVISGIVKEASSTVNPALQTGAAVLGVVASGAQILVEGAELRHNYRKYTEASARKTNAETLLKASDMSPVNLQKEVTSLTSQIQEIQGQLDNPKPLGRFKGLFTTPAKQKAQFEDKLASLKTQLGAIEEVQSKGLSPQAKAVAEQIVESSATKFKGFRMLKNVIGITAGVIGIAVAIGALATPVGWIAAGVSLLALGSVIAYNKYKSSEREGAISSADNKMASVNKELKSIDIQLSREAKNPTLSKEGLAELQTRKTTLLSQKQDAALQLLKVSPEHAAREILNGVQEGNPEMKYIMHTVLNISPKEYEALNSTNQGRNDLLALMKRGMPIAPKL